MAEGKLKKKAKSLDSLIRSQISWWPTYKQSKNVADKLPKNTVKMGTPELYRIVDKAISGPGNQLRIGKKK